MAVKVGDQRIYVTNHISDIIPGPIKRWNKYSIDFEDIDEYM